MATRMQQRRGTAAQWSTANPILAAGEIGFETDTKIMKLGDGTTAWNSLTSGEVSKRGGDTITPSAVGVVPLTVVGLSGQTADLFRATPNTGSAFRVSNTAELYRGTDRFITTADYDTRGRYTRNFLTGGSY